MILDELTLTNFGLYEGSQRITLTPPSTTTPIVLFGGHNGGGKTTLLDALQLCLYGAHARTSNRGRIGYSEYLTRCIHDDVGNTSASIQLAFRQNNNGIENQYKIRRRWRVKNGRCHEEFDVLKDNLLVPALAENWVSEVEEFLPANISHLFMFDGEQIERYASLENSYSLVRTAIQNLLGLDVVDRLDKDVVILERRKKAERLDEEGLGKTREIQRELNGLRKSIDTLKQERATLKNQIERMRKKLNSIAHEISTLGGDTYSRRHEIEAEFTAAETTLRKGEEALRIHAEGPLPLLLIRDLLTCAYKRDQEERVTNNARNVLTFLESRDRSVDEFLASEKVEPRTRSLLQEYLYTDREKSTLLARRTTSLNLTEHGRAKLTQLVGGQIYDLLHETGKYIEDYDAIQSLYSQARSRYESIPEDDNLADVLRTQISLETKLKELLEKEASLAGEEERLRRNAEQSQRSLEILLESGLRDQERLEDRDRILCSAAKVHETLSSFKQAVVRKHIQRIEHLVLESFQHLLHKSSLVANLKIDPITYRVTLFGRRGSELHPDSLSAGERQLLGIALLWGFAKVSGRPLPTAIDTPLGRLDREHRRNVVEKYFPYASHQTLIFSTDEEIVGEYLKMLEPWIGRSYHLVYDSSIHRTVVTPGYFKSKVSNGD